MYEVNNIASLIKNPPSDDLKHIEIENYRKKDGTTSSYKLIRLSYPMVLSLMAARSANEYKAAFEKANVSFDEVLIEKELDRVKEKLGAKFVPDPDEAELRGVKKIGIGMMAREVGEPLVWLNNVIVEASVPTCDGDLKRAMQAFACGGYVATFILKDGGFTSLRVS